MTSRSHAEPETGAYLDKIDGVRRMICGSSLKFCRIAEGAADIYPRLASLSEWDIAAGHALVCAAGGTVTTIDGQPVTYGRPGFRAPPFIARGAAALTAFTLASPILDANGNSGCIAAERPNCGLRHGPESA